MSYNLSPESESDMDFDVTEESDDEFNTTTYFNDDIETSSSSDSNDSLEPSGEGARKESSEAVDGKEKLGDDHAEVTMDIVDIVEGGGITESLEVADTLETYGLEDDYTNIPMDIESPIIRKKNHLILCPVCYEISMLCKDSKYDNLIFACLEQREQRTI